ncbi:MAG: hypothetical protein NTW19_05270 [Planctomycetota bacterium]|nr:hypothetical protein [Planctomycetota bacterium]
MDNPVDRTNEQAGLDVDADGSRRGPALVGPARWLTFATAALLLILGFAEGPPEKSGLLEYVSGRFMIVSFVFTFIFLISLVAYLLAGRRGHVARSTITTLNVLLILCMAGSLVHRALGPGPDARPAQPTTSKSKAAAKPTPAQAERLMEATQWRRMTMAQIHVSVEDAIRANPDQFTFWREYERSFLEDPGIPSLVSSVIRERLMPEEMDAAIAFFESPAGKSYEDQVVSLVPEMTKVNQFLDGKAREKARLLTSRSTAIPRKDAATDDARKGGNEVQGDPEPRPSNTSHDPSAK